MAALRILGDTKTEPSPCSAFRAHRASILGRFNGARQRCEKTLSILMVLQRLLVIWGDADAVHCACVTIQHGALLICSSAVDLQEQPPKSPKLHLTESRRSTSQMLSSVPDRWSVTVSGGMLHLHARAGGLHEELAIAGEGQLIHLQHHANCCRVPTIQLSCGCSIPSQQVSALCSSMTSCSTMQNNTLCECL